MTLSAQGHEDFPRSFVRSELLVCALRGHASSAPHQSCMLTDSAHSEKLFFSRNTQSGSSSRSCPSRSCSSRSCCILPPVADDALAFGPSNGARICSAILTSCGRIARNCHGGPEGGMRRVSLVQLALEKRSWHNFAAASGQCSGTTPLQKSFAASS